MAKTNSTRLEIQKTYKMYIGGAFPRTESGRFYNPEVNGQSLGNVCLASRKDMRNAVVAARSAQANWASRTAYNRSQILYRIAEMLEGRRDQFLSELQTQGLTAAAAKSEVTQSIDRLIYYAGWCDKYQQIFSSVNPVASSHFNFSVLEPKGVVFLFTRESSPLLALVSLLSPIIAGGNTVVVLASESKPLSSITFSEVLNSSDVPAGVVNVLTGNAKEIHEHVARHLDIDAIATDSMDSALTKTIQQYSADSVKLVKSYDTDWNDPENENPYLISDFCEVKTTWHPIEQISVSGSGY
jgi:acyl-CoA reductase-like NAD-dependent aldehyde dehydrogenase